MGGVEDEDDDEEREVEMEMEMWHLWLGLSCSVCLCLTERTLLFCCVVCLFTMCLGRDDFSI